MERQGEEVHVTTEEARGGETRTGLRYVLAISLALVVVLLSAVWITGALGGSQHASDSAVQQDATRSQPITGNGAGAAAPAPTASPD